MAHHFGKHDQFSTPCAKAICLHGTCKALFEPNDCCMCDIIKSSARFWQQTLSKFSRINSTAKDPYVFPPFFSHETQLGGFFHNKELKLGLSSLAQTPRHVNQKYCSARPLPMHCVPMRCVVSHQHRLEE